MLADRLNAVDWGWQVYLEMFIAGIAAGAYVTAALLELRGRGRSRTARTGYLVAFPLVVLAALLLIVDLGRPERFWHMVLQSKTLVPILKLWSPISFGTWVLGIFGLLALVSFVDTLLARAGRGGLLRTDTIRLVWSLVGAIAAFALGSYSGVLLSATNVPGWGETTLTGALYVAIAMATGMATVLLIRVLTGRADADVVDLTRANALLAAWQLVVLALFVVTLGEGARRVFLSGGPAVAIVAAAILGGVVPLLLRLVPARTSGPVIALTSTLILVGGFLLRYAIVMAPQQHG